MAKFVFDLGELDLWPLALTFCIDITLWLAITHEKFMMIRWKEHSVTDRQTDEQTDRQTEVFLDVIDVHPL